MRKPETTRKGGLTKMVNNNNNHELENYNHSLREKIMGILDKLKRHIPHGYFHIHEEKLKMLYHAIEAPPEDKVANVMYDIFHFKPPKVKASSVEPSNIELPRGEPPKGISKMKSGPSKSIGSHQIPYFNDTIQKSVMVQTKTSPFTEKLKNNIKKL